MVGEAIELSEDAQAVIQLLKYKMRERRDQDLEIAYMRILVEAGIRRVM